jgi:hypothetical protein
MIQVPSLVVLSVAWYSLWPLPPFSSGGCNTVESCARHHQLLTSLRMGRPDRQLQIASDLGHSMSARAHHMPIQILELKDTE